MLGLLVCIKCLAVWPDQAATASALGAPYLGVLSPVRDTLELNYCTRSTGAILAGIRPQGGGGGGSTDPEIVTHNNVNCRRQRRRRFCSGHTAGGFFFLYSKYSERRGEFKKG